MAITKISSGLPFQKQLENLNDQTFELDGKVSDNGFSGYEVDQIFTDLAMDKKYLTDVLLGNTLVDYTDWSVLSDETGYSIWKITPSNFSYAEENQLFFDNRLFNYQGEALSETALTYTKVWLYDGSYTDYTSEAGNQASLPFSLFSSTDEYIYLGDATTFNGVYFEFQSRGSGYNLVVEYWNGSAWTTLTSNDNDLDDKTNNWESNGNISWDTIGDWATTDVNGSTQYYIRISTDINVNTTASVKYIIPASSVVALLGLSSTEIIDMNWKWCSYNGSIYTTIRNQGVTDYEGNYFITSSSTTENKQNYFIFNHQFRSNYKDSSYSGASGESGTLTIDLNSKSVELTFVSGLLTNVTQTTSVSDDITWV